MLGLLQGVRVLRLICLLAIWVTLLMVRVTDDRTWTLRTLSPSSFKLLMLLPLNRSTEQFLKEVLIGAWLRSAVLDRTIL